MCLLQFFLPLCRRCNGVSNIRRIISGQTGLIVTVHFHGVIQIAKQAPIVNNQTEIFSCSDTIYAGNSLQQRMLLHRLIYIQHAQGRCVKASQQHTLNNYNINILAADDIVLYIFFVIIILGSKPGFDFIFEEIPDNCFVIFADGAFITFGGNRIIADQRSSFYTAQTVNGTLQLNCQGSGRDCCHCLESAGFTVIKEMLMDVKCDHRQTLFRLRQMYEGTPLSAHILFLRLSQRSKDALQIIVNSVAGHFLGNDTSVINQRNDNTITNTIFKTIGMADLLTELQICVALILPKQRCSGKSDLEGIRKHLVHHVMEFTGMRTVAFVNQKENVLIFDLSSGFCCRFKLVDRCGDQSIATIFQKRNQATSGSCFHRVHASMDKVIPQLFDQI